MLCFWAQVVLPTFMHASLCSLYCAHTRHDANQASENSLMLLVMLRSPNPATDFVPLLLNPQLQPVQQRELPKVEFKARPAPSFDMAGAK